MTKAVVCGALGRMGKSILRLSLEYSDFQVVAGVEHPDCIRSQDLGEASGIQELKGLPLTPRLEEVLPLCDVVIEFSGNPTAAVSHAKLSALAGKGVVIGIELKVIAPEEEGRYAFLSVAYSLRPNGRFCIIDQGGGSTEFVCGRGFQVESLRSLPFGIVNLTEEFIHSDPPKLYELESLKNFLDEQIKEVVEPCDQLIGLGGTITTIAAIEYGIYPYKGEEVHGKELSIDKIMFWIETLSSMKEKDRIANFPHIEPKRAKVIIPGLLIFYRSMLLFGKDKIKVSDWGLKEGLLVEEVIKK